MERQAKQRRSATSRRSAASGLRELAWLAGYPDEGVWRTRAGGAVVVDGALLARSRRLAQTLRREHGESLLALVGDVDAWWSLVDGRLRWLSAHPALVASAAEAPELVALAGPRLERAARTLARRQPALAEAALAATAAWADDAKALTALLDWLAAHPQVAELGVRCALLLTGMAQLARAAAGGVEALIALLSIDAPSPKEAEARLHHAAAQLQRSANPKDQTAPTEAPAPMRRSRAIVLSWLDELAALEPAAQAAVLEVLAVAEIDRAIEPWQQWEARAAPKLERALAMSARRRRADESRAPWTALEAALVVLRGERPRNLWLDVLPQLSLVASGERARHLPAIARWLAAFPEGSGVRPAVLVHCLESLGDADTPKVVALWQRLATARLAGAEERLIDVWRQIFAKDTYWWQESYFASQLAVAQVSRCGDVLVRLSEAGAVRKEDLMSACLWTAAAPKRAAIDEIVTLCVASRGLDFDRRVAHAKAALVLAGDELALAPRLTFALCHVDPEEEGVLAASLVEHARSRSSAWVIKAALLAGQHEAVGLCAAALSLVPRARWPRLVGDDAAAWIERYPAALAAALARLAAVDPDAEMTAEDRLSSDLPSAAALRREITALKARRPLSSRQATRLANLQARLAAPRPPSPKRLETLAQKLESSAVAIGLSRLLDALVARATERLVEIFDLGSWPGWPLDRKLLRILLALTGLPAEERALAGRLLSARAGAPPWDLRDDPENLAYLAELRRRGIVVEPWLEDVKTEVVVEGKPLELAFTSDPLEVFAMGAHFQTCLSPDGCNFFSVVANAADVNKRVLYARQDGRVVGRCLLAITDGGGLLTFQPYCHERIDFAGVVRDFAKTLAARMGTQPTYAGPVRTILAQRWYDDGPRDLTGRFAVIDKLQARDWSAVAPAALPELLRAELRHEIDDVTLPLILRLRCVQERPEMLAALAPFIAASALQSVRIAAANLAFTSGELPLADRLLGEVVELVLDDHGFPYLEVVAQLRPSWTLARIRATRDAWTRQHGEGGARGALLGVALQALHRPRQAVAAYRRALKHDSYLEPYLRARLTALGESPDA